MLVDTVRKIIGILDRQERRHAMSLIVLFIIAAPVEILGVASVMPFLAVLSNPDIVETNKYLAWTYNYFEFTNRQSFFVFLGGALFIGFALTICMQMVKQYAIIHFSHKRIATISSRLLSIYVHQPYSWFLHQHSADLGKNLLNEVAQVVGGVVMPALKLLAEVLTVFFMVGFVVCIDPVIAALSFAFIGLTYGILYAVSRNMLKRIGAEKLIINKERFRYAQEAIGAIKDIKVFGLEGVYVNLFKMPAQRYARLHIIQLLLQNLPSYLMQMTVFGGMLALLMWLLSNQNNNLSTVIPVIGVFALAGRRLLPAVKQIFNSFVSLRFNEAALDLLHHDLKLAEQMNTNDGNDSQARMYMKESLELDDIHFTFEKADRAALQGVSLVIHAKTTVGFVGETGAGKTTAVDLIMGLLEPQQGTIQIDNKVISGQNVYGWRRSVGYVPQHIFLVDDTVAANIAFGVKPEDIDMKLVERAARIAELHNFVISELPLGYQTMVGERGIRLSGGQRQRIGVARALYNEPDVLIMDEATSALDNVTERAVMDAVHNLSNQKTIILIAHRLSTVKSCDQIFLFERGKLVAEGTYVELVENNMKFRTMASNE